ncbi:MAG: hypothetical protein U9Q81_25430 [Pseudomonadota bacterium]|nr:hypothetical protein [Pseudomonadota bacterium]
MKPHTLMGEIVHALREDLRSAPIAIRGLADIAREAHGDLSSDGEWPAWTNDYRFDAILMAIGGLAGGLYRQITFAVGDDDEDGGPPPEDQGSRRLCDGELSDEQTRP